MGVRDDVEGLVRGWDAFERSVGGQAVVDFDCVPGGEVAGISREVVRERLVGLRGAAEGAVLARIDADVAYLDALLGARVPLDEYVRATQGCGVAGWSDEYLHRVAGEARAALDAVGVAWGEGANRELREVEGRLDVGDAPDAIRDAVAELEPVVRAATGSTAAYRLTMESVAVDDVYWAYWLDGAGDEVRLRLNLPHIDFTAAGARQFALHEVLGHGLQSVSLAARAAREDVPWVRVFSVHALYQVMLEGLAQALPLFLLPDDAVLVARTRLDHFVQLVRARSHLAVNAGASVDEAAADMLAWMPWWDGKIGRQVVKDRRDDPLLRSYLWVYPAGADWFVRLAEADAGTADAVLRTAYREPLTPDDLVRLWPDGPVIGGPGA